MTTLTALHSPASFGQSRRGSLLEAITNVVIGFIVAIVAQYLLFPLFGLHASPIEHGAIAATFTLISLIRSYLLRRLFVRLDACRARERLKRQASLERRLATGRL